MANTDNEMTRTDNQKERDIQIVNALAAILSELQNISTKLGGLTPNKKGR